MFADYIETGTVGTTDTPIAYTLQGNEQFINSVLIHNLHASQNLLVKKAKASAPTTFDYKTVGPGISFRCSPRPMVPFVSDIATGGSAILLNDTSVDFTTLGVAAGDVLKNTTKSSVGIITAVAATALTIASGMSVGVNANLDAYQVLRRGSVVLKGSGAGTNYEISFEVKV